MGALVVERERGFALIAVLVVLAILATLAAPFLLGMGHGESAALAIGDAKRVDLAAESARDLVLAQARRSHPSVDATPDADDRSEFPDRIALGALDALGDRMLLAGETEDLQRRINLTTASPLAFANLLGLAATITVDHEAEATEIQVDDATGFPDAGYVFVDRELIRYGSRDGNLLRDLERGLRVLEDGYRPAKDHELKRGMQLLDYRCVLAACWSITYRHADDPEQPGRRDRWTPWRSVGEIAQIARAGFGGFTAAQMDRLHAFGTTDSVRDTAGEFGRSERVFSPIDVGDHRLTVRAAGPLSAGTIVRLRTLGRREVEYGMVAATHDQRGSLAVNLPTAYLVELMRPVERSYPAIDTFVEPLLQHPVNLNTASREVLVACTLNLRPGAGVDGGRQQQTAPISRVEAERHADLLLALRGDGGAPPDGFDPDPRPFDSFEDLARRLFQPLFDATERVEDKFRLAWIFIGWMQGSDGAVLDYALPPMTTVSGSVVGYRAAAAQNQPLGTRGATRIERSGTALAMPGRTLDHVLGTQLDFESASRFERQTPWYMTGPINVAGAVRFEPGTEPAPRYFAHLIGMLLRDQNLGGPRFPSRDGNGAGFQLAPASIPLRIAGWRHDNMFASLDPEGRNVETEGAYAMQNLGPKGGVAQQGPPEPPIEPRSGTEGFPFTTAGGFVKPHGTHLWFQVRDLSDQAIYDLAAGDAERNRISLTLRDNELRFEVLDEAGFDPEPTRTKTQVERTAGTWRVPLGELAFEPETWFHANLSALGNRPDQIRLFVDGVPRGQVSFLTTLAQPLPEYRRPGGGRSWREDSAKFMPIRVESTDGFPDQGVLRIGLELFEYTSKDATTFYCTYDDSFGGRVTRMDLREYRPEIPLDANGRPSIDIDKLTGGVDIDFAPAIPAGAAVELYGYALPVYRQHVIQVGSARLTTGIGAFAVARAVVNQNPRPIEVQWGNTSHTLGQGIDETWNGEIELADPLPDAARNSPPPGPAMDGITGAFSTSGGYALLVQKHVKVDPPASSGNPVSAEVGGVELIQYGARQGSKLTGITRAVQLRPLQGRNDPRGFFDGKPHKFVTKWTGLDIGQTAAKSAAEFATYLCYIVPISLPVAGNLIDPSTTGISEWVQLEGARDAETEWVRYDWIESGQILRTNFAAWERMRFELTQQEARLAGSASNSGAIVFDPVAWAQNPYPIPAQYGLDYIGHVPDLEVKFSVIHAARRVLGFRGDSFTGTSSHPHASTALVLQCHRFEQDWGNLGARSARSGRLDRVALVAGSQASGETRPSVEWHTVNWVARRFTGDLQQVQQGQPRSSLPELLGPYPFQLVAFKTPVRALYVGPDERNDLIDSRQIDRLIKFPSGELPAAWPSDAIYGGSQLRDPRPMRGIVDEVAAMERRAAMLLLDEPMPADAKTFVVRENARPTPVGPVFESRRLTSEYPQAGGLVAIGDEIVAYRSHADGRFEVAANGRAMLGTIARAHAPGEIVQFLENVPAAILSASLAEDAWELLVQDLGALPQHGGTLLVGRELLHYCWSSGATLLEMPRWLDPSAQDPTPRGLFRARYGTTAQALEGGSAVVGFPFRYWDRQHDRAEDPELAHWQITFDTGPVWLEGLYWEDDQRDPLAGIECLARADGLASWTDEPGPKDELWLFERGRTGDDGSRPAPNLLRRQASRLELRFRTRYLDGAYDAVRLNSHSWKRAPSVRGVVLTYEGEGRILSEQVTAR